MQILIDPWEFIHPSNKIQNAFYTNILKLQIGFFGLNTNGVYILNFYQAVGPTFEEWF